MPQQPLVVARGRPTDYTLGMARKLEPGRLVLATHNAGKVRELGALMVPYGMTVVSAGELGLPVPDETESTFAGNARLKALASALGSGLPALADDSGLSVDALDGQPGVHTADWAETPDGRDWYLAMRKVEDLLRARGPDMSRACHFTCALAVAWPDGHAEVFEGTAAGMLTWPPRGTVGFGYDPVFVARRLCADVRRAAARDQARHQPPRGDLPAAGGGVSPLAVYIHWPFCVTKCPYCDFNSHVRTRRDEAGWQDALLADLAHEARLTPGRTVGSIFFGGGTPSLMAPETVAAVVDAVGRLWQLDGDAEVTLEANPTSVEAARFAGFRAAGVNRVSVGLQALDDAALKQLGRPHDLRQGLAALDVALRTFAAVSFDLIYTRPGQITADWEAELTRALAFGTGHMSLYQLTIEAGTRFATLQRDGRLRLPDDDTAADQFALTQALTEAAGLTAYEISNHARPGAESRHNLTYWRYGDYVGVGPGAHGRRGGLATLRHRTPERWAAAVAAAGHGLESETALDAAEARLEALLMGLRTRDGVVAAAGDPLLDWPAIARLSALELVRWDAGVLRTLPPGRPVLNAVLGEIVRA